MVFLTFLTNSFFVSKIFFHYYFTLIFSESWSSYSEISYSVGPNKRRASIAVFRKISCPRRLFRPRRKFFIIFQPRNRFENKNYLNRPFYVFSKIKYQIANFLPRTINFTFISKFNFQVDTFRKIVLEKAKIAPKVPFRVR